jgi:Acyl-CoA dehydrogenase, C-terminal domain
MPGRFSSVTVRSFIARSLRPAWTPQAIVRARAGVKRLDRVVAFPHLERRERSRYGACATAWTSRRRPPRAGQAPIIDCQDVGYVLGDVAARIEACRFFCWKTAHYMDQHDYHGEPIGATCKAHCTELLFDAVFKCLQVVGVNNVDRTHLFEKYLREATIRPLYACPRDACDIGEIERSSRSELPVLSGVEERISRPTDSASRPKSSSDR